MQIFEKIDLDNYIYDEDAEVFARIHIDGEPTKYAISDHGRVWGEVSKKFLKPHEEKNQYYKFFLRIDGKYNYCLVHRLVANAFVYNPNPEQNTQVDHLNMNRTDNRAINLEWVSPSENTRRTYSVGGRDPSHTFGVFAYEIKTGNTTFFESAHNCDVSMGLARGTTVQICAGEKRNSSNGYIFGRAEDFDKDKIDAILSKVRFCNTGRPIVNISKDGAVNRYECEADACRKTGIKHGTLNSWLSGRRKPRDGSIWKYESEDFVPLKIRC